MDEKETLEQLADRINNNERAFFCIEVLKIFNEATDLETKLDALTLLWKIGHQEV